jgi:sugar lactone lactonase YvrE
MKNGVVEIGRKLGCIALLLFGRIAFSQNTAGAPLEVVAKIRAPDSSGVAITPGGRLFLGFPRHADDHHGATLAEYKNGVLTPYPSAAVSLPGQRDPAKRLVSVHGMATDTRGRLWMIDDGKEAGKPIQLGAVKVVGIDSRTNRIIAWVVLPEGVYLPQSHMNDLRIDLTHGKQGTAFVTDSSFGQQPALVVVDIVSGKSRRILQHSPFTADDHHFMTYLEGLPHVWSADHSTFPQGGADGIELSPDSRTLYWTSLSGRELWSAPTSTLADPHATEKQINAAVQDLGERPNADGLARDDQGQLFFGAFDQRSLIRRNLDGSYSLIAHDNRLGWPDGLCVHNGYLYVTLGQWNRLASFNGGHDLRKPPFLLVRIKLLQ